jgi:hypothetical protein
LGGGRRKKKEWWNIELGNEKSCWGAEKGIGWGIEWMDGWKKGEIGEERMDWLA